jgi:hypothetical protein
MHAGQLLISLLGSSCSLLRAHAQVDGPRLSVPERLAMFPVDGLPIRGCATVYDESPPRNGEGRDDWRSVGR